MRVVDHQAPTPFRDIDAEHAAAPERARVRRARRRCCRCALRGPARARARAARAGLGAWTSCWRWPRALPSGLYSGSGIEDYMRTVLADPDRTDDFRQLEQRAVPRRDRPRHVRADRVRRRRAGTTCRSPPPCAPRPRCRWSTSPYASSDRELVDGGIVSTTNLDIAVEAGAKFVVVVNPLVPYVNDFAQGDPTLRTRRAGLRHGLPADRLPDVQADGLPAPARDAHAVGGALPRRRHRPDRARGRRRADVPHEHHGLRVARADRQSRLPVGDGEAGRGLHAAQAGRGAPRDRDLRHARAQGRQALRHRARADPRLAQDPRADDGRAAARSPPATECARLRPPCGSASSRRSVAARLWIVARMWSRSPTAVAGRDDDARTLQAWPARPGCAGMRSQTAFASLGAASIGRSCRRSSRRVRSAATRSRRAATCCSQLCSASSAPSWAGSADAERRGEPLEQRLRARAAEHVADAQAGEAVGLREACGRSAGADGRRARQRRSGLAR